MTDSGKVELINEKDKGIIFSSHVYFPGTVIVGNFFGYLKTIAGLKCFLIISKPVYESIGEKIKEVVSLNEGEGVFVIDEEPTCEMLKACEGLVGKSDYDYILAIGGGSVIDTAKLVGKELDKKLVVAPTTPATGSEATPYSVLVDVNEGKKVVRSSKELLPDVVVLDSSFMNTIGRRQMGYFIMDILGHSLEALVSKRSNCLSDSFALESIRLVFENYEKVKEPYDLKILEKILISGFLGGLAQNMAAVGLAHAFAHFFGAKCKIGHGKAVSVFIDSVVKFNKEKCDKYDKIESLGLDEGIVEKLIKVKEYFGIEGEKIPYLKEEKDKAIGEIKRDICAITNPVFATDEELLGILEKCVESK